MVGSQFIETASYSDSIIFVQGRRAMHVYKPCLVAMSIKLIRYKGNLVGFPPILIMGEATVEAVQTKQASGIVCKRPWCSH